MSRTEDWARFLEKNLKNLDYRELTNRRIDECVELIRSGLNLNEVQKRLGLGKNEAAIIFELGHSRINIKGKFERWNRLWMDQYLSSYSTPEVVCRYRAERITGYRVLEAGSGAGMQSIFLSQTNDSTLSVEVKPERYRMARLNAEEYGARKVRFVNGDIYGLSGGIDIDENTVVFSDPARPPVEGERSMDTLIPSPASLVKVFGSKTRNFVFDLPPQIKWDNIGIEGEKEYISINGNLNRLTLYCGSLMKAESSAVLLPEGIRISGNPSDVDFPDTATPGKYLLLPDVSLVYAKLLQLLVDRYGIRPCWKDNRRYVFTSDTAIETFPGEKYEVLYTCSEDDLQTVLIKCGAGRVFFRFSMEESAYYSNKAALERQLDGDRDVYIFRNAEVFFVTSRA